MKNKLRRMRAAAACAAVLAATGCSMEWPQCGPATTEDPALADAGLGVPKPLPLDMGLIDAPAVAAHYEGPTRFVAAVLRQDYGGAQQYFEEIAAMADASQRMREIYRLKFALDGRGMYLLGPAQQWLAAQPQSDTARVLLGMALATGATQARGAAYTSKTSPAQMARFRQRFEQARVHLEAVTARGGVAAALAHAGLQLPYFYAGEEDKGWASIDTLIAQAPQYGWLYFWATEYAKPKWAGQAASERLQHLADLADLHQLNAADRKVLDQELAHVRNDMDDNGDPKAWRPYWSQRTAQAPYLRNVVQWLGYERSVENWPMVEKLATQAIELNPQQTYSYYLRGLARKEMGRPEEAWRDTLAAAVLGSDAAMGNLVYAHLQGTMGAKAGDHQSMFAYCKMGAAFGLPAAANCIAASYTDGFAGVVGDDLEAARWHLLAARGANSNSQHDLAVLLPRVNPGKSAEAMAQYWMREAARRGHAYARNKALPEAEPSTPGLLCLATAAAARLLRSGG